MVDRAGVRKALALLEDSEFRTATAAFDTERAKLREALRQGKSDQAAAELRVEQLLAEFSGRWRVLPPLDYALFAPAPSEAAKAVLAGDWGLIPVFPWTSERDALRAFRAIRSRLPRRHADSRARAQLDRRAAWLLDSGFSTADVAVAVYGRTRGLKASKRLSRADALTAKYWDNGKGMAYLKAEARARREARDREAPAAAQVRMAATRARKAEAAGRDARTTPKETEPLSGAITAALRAAYHGPNADALLAALDRLRRSLLGQPTA